MIYLWISLLHFSAKQEEAEEAPSLPSPRAHFFRIGKAGKGGKIYSGELVGLPSQFFSFFLEAMLLPLLFFVTNVLHRYSTDLRRAKPRSCQIETDGKKLSLDLSHLLVVAGSDCCWCWWVWIREEIWRRKHKTFFSLSFSGTHELWILPSWSQKRKIHQSLLLLF